MQLVVQNSSTDFECQTLEGRIKFYQEEGAKVEQDILHQEYKAAKLIEDLKASTKCKPALENLSFLIERLKDLNIEIRDTENLARSKGNPEGFPNSTSSSWSSEFGKYDEIKTSMYWKSRNDNLTKVKLLYRKLVRLTHPDKILDKELNSLFTVICSAYVRRDLRALKHLDSVVSSYLESKTDVKTRKSVLLKALDKAKTSLEQLVIKKIRQKDTAGSKLLHEFETSGIENVESLFISQLQRHYLLLSNQYNATLQKLFYIQGLTRPSQDWAGSWSTGSFTCFRF